MQRGADMRCMVCGQTAPDGFSLYGKEFLCDDCYSIMKYHYEKAKEDLQKNYRESHITELWECEVLEGLQEFVDKMIEEYNEEVKSGNVSRHTASE